MAKILLWVLIGFAVYAAWRWWQIKQLSAHRRDEAGAGARIDPEAMVPCDVCGLNVPRSEALPANGRYYCSDEHRQRGRG